MQYIFAEKFRQVMVSLTKDRVTGYIQFAYCSKTINRLFAKIFAVNFLLYPFVILSNISLPRCLYSPNTGRRMWHVVMLSVKKLNTFYKENKLMIFSHANSMLTKTIILYFIIENVQLFPLFDKGEISTCLRRFDRWQS